jgi:hypothetical protein
MELNLKFEVSFTKDNGTLTFSLGLGDKFGIS